MRVEHIAHQQCRFHDFVEAALLRVEIDQDEVRTVEGVDAAHPGVVVDAAQIHQIQQAGAVLGEDVLDGPARLDSVCSDQILTLRSHGA